MADLESHQTSDRFIHILGVLQTILALAEINQVDLEKATLAALLHDCAKHVDREKTMNLNSEGHIHLDGDDLQYPALWHGPVGAYYARTVYHVQDPEILDAVEHHTLGHKNPSKLLQILMAADSCEPTRNYPAVDKLRLLVREDLKKGLVAVLKHKTEDIKQRNLLPHPRIFETLESLEN